MSNLYLLKSKVKDKKDNGGDVFINLYYLTSLQSAQISEDKFHLVVSLNKDNNGAIFSKKEDVLNEIKLIIKQIGGDTSIVDNYEIEDLSERNKQKQKLQELFNDMSH